MNNPGTVIQSIEITCNIAFLEVCIDPNVYYALRCSGQQYPNYPCFGSPESGYAQHSSICRAALSSGIPCGCQFLVYCVGDSDKFTATNHNGVRSIPYNDWSKVFRVKEVNEALNEHKRLKMNIQSFERDKRLMGMQIEEIDKQREMAFYTDTVSKSRVKLLEKTNLDLNKRLRSAEQKFTNNMVSLPRSEVDALKRTRVQLSDQLLNSKKQLSDLESENLALKRLIEKLDREKKQAKIADSEKKNRVQKLNDFCPESSIDRFNALPDKIAGIIQDFEASKKSKNKQNVKSSTNQQMKPTLDLLEKYKPFSSIERLKFFEDVAGGHFSGKRFSHTVQSLEKVIEKIQKLNSEKFKSCPAEKSTAMREKLCKFDATLKDAITAKNLNLSGAHPIIDIASNILNSDIISASDSLFSSNTEELEKAKAAYQSKKEALKSLQDVLENHKKKKDVSEALRTAGAIQKISRDEILPENEKLRTLLVGGKPDVAEGSVKGIDFKFLDGKIKSSEDNLKQLEGLNPLSKEEAERLKRKKKDLEKTIDQEGTKLSEIWKQLDLLMGKYSQCIKKTTEIKLQTLDVSRDIDAMGFKKIRWCEAKETKKDELKNEITERKALKYFLTALSSFALSGRVCLEAIRQKRRAETAGEIEQLEKDYRQVFSVLFESVTRDCKNKKKQLEGISKKRKNLEEQLEEAIEIMDEESVESLTAQIKKMPQKEADLKERIAAFEKEIEKMKKSKFYTDDEKTVDSDNNLPRSPTSPNSPNSPIAEKPTKKSKVEEKKSGKNRKDPAAKTIKSRDRKKSTEKSTANSRGKKSTENVENKDVSNEPARGDKKDLGDNMEKIEQKNDKEESVKNDKVENVGNVGNDVKTGAENNSESDSNKNGAESDKNLNQKFVDEEENPIRFPKSKNRFENSTKNGNESPKTPADILKESEENGENTANSGHNSVKKEGDSGHKSGNRVVSKKTKRKKRVAKEKALNSPHGMGGQKKDKTDKKVELEKPKPAKSRGLFFGLFS